MTKLDKRTARMRSAPRSVSSELISILEKLDFELRRKKKKHWCYWHPDLPHILLVIPDQNSLKPVYVRQALRVIDELGELENHE